VHNVVIIHSKVAYMTILLLSVWKKIGLVYYCYMCILTAKQLEWRSLCCLT